MLIYLGGPIDEATHEQASGWKGELRDKLETAMEQITYHVPAAFTFFDPYAAFSSVNFHGQTRKDKLGITSTNRHFLGGCDVAVFWVEHSAKPFGTIREIEFATVHGVPVLVISRDESLLNHVEMVDLQTVIDLDEATDWLLFHLGESVGQRLVESEDDKEEPTELTPGPVASDPYEELHAALAGHLVERRRAGLGASIQAGSVDIARARNQMNTGAILRVVTDINDDGRSTIILED